jgi:hypothetical protein
MKGIERQVWKKEKRVDNLKKRDKIDSDFKKTGKLHGRNGLMQAMYRIKAKALSVKQVLSQSAVMNFYYPVATE